MLAKYLKLILNIISFLLIDESYNPIRSIEIN